MELAHDEVCYFGILDVRDRDCVRNRDPASSHRSVLAGLHELLQTVIPSTASPMPPVERYEPRRPT